jgi:hypothetical protein
MGLGRQIARNRPRSPGPVASGGEYRPGSGHAAEARPGIRRSSAFHFVRDHLPCRVNRRHTNALVLAIRPQGVPSAGSQPPEPSTLAREAREEQPMTLRWPCIVLTSSAALAGPPASVGRGHVGAVDQDGDAVNLDCLECRSGVRDPRGVRCGCPPDGQLPGRNAHRSHHWGGHQRRAVHRHHKRSDGNDTVVTPCWLLEGGAGPAALLDTRGPLVGRNVWTGI